MEESFSPRLVKAIIIASEETSRMGHGFITPYHLLFGIALEHRGIGGKTLRKMGVKMRPLRLAVDKCLDRIAALEGKQVTITDGSKEIISFACEEAKLFGFDKICTDHLLLGLLLHVDLRNEAPAGSGIIGFVLHELGLTTEMIRELAFVFINTDQTNKNSPRISEQSSSPRGIATVRKYGTHLNLEVLKGNIDPVVGRVEQIDRSVQVLGRRRKNNPVLVGEPGVGKTAIAEGLAQLIITGDVPPNIAEKEIFILDVARLVSGASYRGQFEDRLKNVMQEVAKNKHIILVLDEMHTLIGAGSADGAIDAANILKPALARGEFRCIGATTLDEYSMYVETDPALERRFQPVRVDEPSIEETIEILKGLTDKYEEYHKVKIDEKALGSAVNMASKYLTDRYFPDKAIDLIDEASSRCNVQRRTRRSRKSLNLQKSLEELCLQKEEAIRRDDFDKASSLRDQEVLLRYNFESLMRKEKDQLQNFDPILTTVEINQVISTWTGVPLTRINTSEAERLLQMESTLQERVIGQKEAVVAIAKSIRRARAGLKDSKRPIACLMFAGSTGVGKTELVKALAEYFYDGEDSMARFDMSEYMMRYTVAKLIGAPPGYLGFQDGGRLTEAVRVKPYSLVLFDEIEKAHMDVLNIMLQVFDDGRLTDSRGRVIMFNNTLIILTSNIGAWEIQMSYGITKRDPYSRDRFGETNDRDRQERYKQVKEDVHVAMEKKFRPEFINRLDEIIVFKPLSRSQLEKICEILIRSLAKRLKEQELLLKVTTPVRKKLSIMGDDPAYGARPLRRAVVNTVENLLANILLTRPKDVDTLETTIILLNKTGDFDLKLKT